MAKGILIDVTKCIGCRSCQVACKQWNNLPATATSFNPDWNNPPRLSDTNWTSVEHKISQAGGGQVSRRFVKTQCMHCLEPACASACFVGAFQKTEAGPVVYDPAKCVGCRYCMVACPFWIPKYQWDERFPLVRKCRMCFERVSAGMQPACVTACPSGTTKFGEREGLLKEAWARIRQNPGAYVPQVYGEQEVGGTSVLYLADVPFERLGFPVNLTTRPLPRYTWDVLNKIPFVLVGWGGLLTAMSAYTRRRAEVKAAEEREKEGGPPCRHD